MTTTSDAELQPRLFPVRRLGDEPPAEAAPDGPADGDDDDDEPACVDCLNGVPLAATYLTAGDRITEVDTPDGPFYTVVEIDRDAGVLVVDPGDGLGPVPLAVDMTGVVLKEPGSPAR